MDSPGLKANEFLADEERVEREQSAGTKREHERNVNRNKGQCEYMYEYNRSRVLCIHCTNKRYNCITNIIHSTNQLYTYKFTCNRTVHF